MKKTGSILVILQIFLKCVEGEHSWQINIGLMRQHFYATIEFQVWACGAKALSARGKEFQLVDKISKLNEMCMDYCDHTLHKTRINNYRVTWPTHRLKFTHWYQLALILAHPEILIVCICEGRLTLSLWLWYSFMVMYRNNHFTYQVHACTHAYILKTL